MNQTKNKRINRKFKVVESEFSTGEKYYQIEIEIRFLLFFLIPTPFWISNKVYYWKFFANDDGGWAENYHFKTFEAAEKFAKQNKNNIEKSGFCHLQYAQDFKNDMIRIF